MAGATARTDIGSTMSIDAADPTSASRRDCAQSAAERIAAHARAAYAAAAVLRVAAMPADQVARLETARADVAAEASRYLSYTSPGY